MITTEWKPNDSYEEKKESGTNNIYTTNIYKSLNKENYLKKREFSNIDNGIAFYSDKNKKLFFDVVQPNSDMISSNLSAGTLSIELSSFGEKILTNCGASESFGKNPEYLSIFKFVEFDFLLNFPL